MVLREKFRFRLIALVGLLLGTTLSCSYGGETTSAVEPLPTFAATVEGALPTVVVTPVSPGIPERRLLVLEWPDKIRQGDSDIIRLTLQMDERGQLTATAEIEGNEITSTPIEIPNLYETHTVQAQARLDLGGVAISPSDTFNQALLPGEEVTFYWSVHPEEVGRYRGTVWFGLRFLPKAGGEVVEKQISAQVIEIQSVNFLGMSGSAARLLGGAGVLVSSLFGLEDLLVLGKKLAARRKKPV
jgi:hypothetical protein